MKKSKSFSGSLSNSNEFNKSLSNSHFSQIIPSGVTKLPGNRSKRIRQKEKYVDIHNEKQNYQTVQINNTSNNQKSHSKKKKSNSADNSQKHKAFNSFHKNFSYNNISNHTPTSNVKLSNSSSTNSFKQKSNTFSKEIPLNNNMHLIKKNTQTTKTNNRYETNNNQNYGLGLNLNMIANSTRKSNSNSKSKHNTQNLNENAFSRDMKTMVHSASMNALQNTKTLLHSNSTNSLSLHNDSSNNKYSNNNNKFTYEINIDKQKEKNRELAEIQKLKQERMLKDKEIQTQQKQIEQYQKEYKQKQFHNSLNNNNRNDIIETRIRPQQDYNQVNNNIIMKQEQEPQQMDISLIKLNEQKNLNQQLLKDKEKQIEEIKQRHQLELASLKAKQQSQTEKHLREINSQKQKELLENKRKEQERIKMDEERMRIIEEQRKEIEFQTQKRKEMEQLLQKESFLKNQAEQALSQYKLSSSKQKEHQTHNNINISEQLLNTNDYIYTDDDNDINKQQTNFDLCILSNKQNNEKGTQFTRNNTYVTINEENKEKYYDSNSKDCSLKMSYDDENAKMKFRSRSRRLLDGGRSSEREKGMKRNGSWIEGDAMFKKRNLFCERRYEDFYDLRKFKNGNNDRANLLMSIPHHTSKHQDIKGKMFFNKNSTIDFSLSSILNNRNNINNLSLSTVNNNSRSFINSNSFFNSKFPMSSRNKDKFTMPANPFGTVLQAREYFFFNDN